MYHEITDRFRPVGIALIATMYVVTALLTTSCGTDWSRIEEAAVSGAPPEQAKILDPDVRKAFLDTGETLLPADSTLDVLEETFTEREPGYAEAEAVVTGSAEGRYLLRLTEEDGDWLILEAVPLGGS